MEEQTQKLFSELECLKTELRIAVYQHRGAYDAKTKAFNDLDKSYHRFSLMDFGGQPTMAKKEKILLECCGGTATAHRTDLHFLNEKLNEYIKVHAEEIAANKKVEKGFLDVEAKARELLKHLKYTE